MRNIFSKSLLLAFLLWGHGSLVASASPDQMMQEEDVAMGEDEPTFPHGAEKNASCDQMLCDDDLCLPEEQEETFEDYVSVHSLATLYAGNPTVPVTDNDIIELPEGFLLYTPSTYAPEALCGEKILILQSFCATNIVEDEDGGQPIKMLYLRSVDQAKMAGNANIRGVAEANGCTHVCFDFAIDQAGNVETRQFVFYEARPSTPKFDTQTSQGDKATFFTDLLTAHLGVIAAQQTKKDIDTTAAELKNLTVSTLAQTGDSSSAGSDDGDGGE